MEGKNVFDYIITESTNWKINRIPLTNSKDWSMYEHIQRCTNVANAWFHSGNNDGLRPYDDLVTPIINLAFRLEGFDVKHIIPFVNDINENYKSFIVKKRHPQWARDNELDTFIDDVVETSVIYDLVLVKNVNNVRPEVVDLRTIAFCDQTDVMAGPICIKHEFTPAELVDKKGKWYDKEIDFAISQAVQEKTVNIANDEKASTPSKYIEVFELRGNLPEYWVDENGSYNKYTPQTHLVCFYKDINGNKQGITLFKGKDKPLSENFKALKIDRIRSKGRACGRSIVESLFEPQVWNNYSAIKIKDLLDSALTIFQTDSLEYKGKKIKDLKTNTVLYHEPNKPLTKVDGTVQNLTAFTNNQDRQGQNARIIASASEGALGLNPTAGTPFALNNQVIQEGAGIHEYRQGKIATFFADVLYPSWILKWLIDDLNTGKKFSEELSLDEMHEIYEQIARNKAEKKINEMYLSKNGKPVYAEDREALVKEIKDNLMKSGKRGFFESIKDELKNIPVDVLLNIKGKQRNMIQNADSITNIIRQIISNPEAFRQIPALGKAFNQLLEESGMNPIDYSSFTKLESPTTTTNQVEQPQVKEAVL